MPSIFITVQGRSGEKLKKQLSKVLGPKAGQAGRRWEGIAATHQT